jgi:hypothetical protein
MRKSRRATVPLSDTSCKKLLKDLGSTDENGLRHHQGFEVMRMIRKRQCILLEARRKRQSARGQRELADLAQVRLRDYQPGLFRGTQPGCVNRL